MRTVYKIELALLLMELVRGRQTHVYGRTCTMEGLDFRFNWDLYKL